MTDPDPDKPRRRPRYRGKNPRHFHEKYKEHQPGRYPEEAAKVLASGRTPVGTHRPIMMREVLDVLSQKGAEEDSLVEAAVRERVRALVHRFPIYQG